MSIQPIKIWFHQHIHTPSTGPLAANFNHLVHNANFWVLLIASALIAMFIILAIFAAIGRPAELPNTAFPYIY